MDETLARILALIDERKLSDQQFQRDLGLSISAVSEWRKGKTTSYLRRISEIADYFSVSADYLLGITDKKDKPSQNRDGLTEKQAELYALLENAQDEDLEKVTAFLKELQNKR